MSAMRIEEVVVSLISGLGQDLMSTHRGDWPGRIAPVLGRMFPFALEQSRSSGRVDQLVSVGRGGVLMRFEAATSRLYSQAWSAVQVQETMIWVTVSGELGQGCVLMYWHREPVWIMSAKVTVRSIVGEWNRV